jgi:hypothetical protein
MEMSSVLEIKNSAQLRLALEVRMGGGGFKTAAPVWEPGNGPQIGSPCGQPVQNLCFA